MFDKILGKIEGSDHIGFRLYVPRVATLLDCRSSKTSSEIAGIQSRGLGYRRLALFEYPGIHPRLAGPYETGHVSDASCVSTHFRRDSTELCDRD